MGTSQPGSSDERGRTRRDAVPPPPLLDTGATTLSVRRERDGRLASELVVVRGEVDLVTASRLAAVLEAALRGPAPTVVVDVGGLAFCDVGGLRLLAQTARRLHEQGRTFALRRPSRFLRRLLEISGFDPAIVIDDDAQLATPTELRTDSGLDAVDRDG